jgi:hypothetical protein
MNRCDETILILIQSLIANKRIDEAVKHSNEMQSKIYKKTAIIEIGKGYLSQNKDLAHVYFSNAYLLYPEDVKLYFYANLSNILQKDFIEKIYKLAKSAKDLTDIAWLYDNEKKINISKFFFQKAIEKDKDYYPARFGYVQMLGAAKIFAKNEFDQLLKILPENYQLLFWEAKILSWIKDFTNSLEIYSVLEDINPKDPVIIREKARVASWDNNNSLAMQTLEKALRPSVDSSLYEYLIVHDYDFQDPKYEKDLNFLKMSSFYYGYEKIKNSIKKYLLSESQKRNLELALLNFSAEYEIQKSIFLEKESKNFFYQMQYMHANTTYKRLVEFMPYNQEAIFDYAQTFCYINLCDKAQKKYKFLVNEFSDDIAKSLYEENIIRSQPYFDANHWYYEEAGRGDIDRIKRNRTDISFGFPITCRHEIIFMAHRWVEKPTYRRNTEIKDVEQIKGKTYDAYGYSVDYEGIFSKYVLASARFTQKYYLNHFKYINLGHINLLFNILDWVDLNIGFRRRNELDNIFSLRNNIRNNILFVEANSFLKRRISIEASSKSMIYSDNNFIQLCDMILGFRITQFPTILKLSVRSEYRNSDKTNVYVYDGPNLINIIHPYWTPKDYFACKGVLNWHHDISKLYLCGSEKHYYELEFSGGSDTEKNPAIRFFAAWFVEFKKRCLFNIKGYVHRSRLWNSESVEAEFKCYF